jgi:hypothetical protein
MPSRWPTLTQPTPAEQQTLLRSNPEHTFSSEEVDRFLGTLHYMYPEATLVVSLPVTIFEIHASSGRRYRINGHLAILEPTTPYGSPFSPLLRLLGGPLGTESCEIDTLEILAHLGQHGWPACTGIPGQLNACFVPADNMQQAYTEYCRATQIAKRPPSPPQPPLLRFH